MLRYYARKNTKWKRVEAQRRQEVDALEGFKRLTSSTMMHDDIQLVLDVSVIDMTMTHI